MFIVTRVHNTIQSILFAIIKPHMVLHVVLFIGVLASLTLVVKYMVARLAISKVPPSLAPVQEVSPSSPVREVSPSAPFRELTTDSERAFNTYMIRLHNDNPPDKPTVVFTSKVFLQGYATDTILNMEIQPNFGLVMQLKNIRSLPLLESDITNAANLIDQNDGSARAIYIPKETINKVDMMFMRNNYGTLETPVPSNEFKLVLIGVKEGHLENINAFKDSHFIMQIDSFTYHIL